MGDTNLYGWTYTYARSFNNLVLILLREVAICYSRSELGMHDSLAPMDTASLLVFVIVSQRLT